MKIWLYVEHLQQSVNPQTTNVPHHTNVRISMMRGGIKGKIWKMEDLAFTHRSVIHKNFDWYFVENKFASHLNIKLNNFGLPFKLFL